MKSGKGQLTVEFVVVFAVLFLAFIALLAVAIERNSGYNEKLAFSGAGEKASFIAQAINELCLSGSNSRIAKDFSLGSEFSAQVNGKYLEISYRANFFDYPLICKAEGIIENGKISELYNEKGTVKIRGL